MRGGVAVSGAWTETCTPHVRARMQVNLENDPAAGLIGEALLFPRCACGPRLPPKKLVAETCTHR
jgi:hypothetical protein